MEALINNSTQPRAANFNAVTLEPITFVGRLDHTLHTVPAGTQVLVDVEYGIAYLCGEPVLVAPQQYDIYS